MPSNPNASIQRFSTGAVAGPSTDCFAPMSSLTRSISASTVMTSSTFRDSQTTGAPAPTSVTFQPSKYILLPPRRESNAAPSPIPHDRNNHPSVAEQQQSRSAIRKANVLANWTSSIDHSHPTSGTVTRSSSVSSTRSISPTMSYSTASHLDHSTSIRAESGRPTSTSSLGSSESGSSRADSDFYPSSSSSSSSQPSLTNGMSNTYFPLHLSTPDPLQSLFKGPDGRALFSTTTRGRTTVIRRLYGRSAKTFTTTKQKENGLVLAEIEWMDRVRSSRIRFKGVDVDVRIDEYLKETRSGSGQSRMFATSDGRTYKWKAGSTGESAELFECASGKRVSGLLASSNPYRPSSNSLPTPPPTPPIILSPSPSAAYFSASSSPSASIEGFEVPSISLSEPETSYEGEKPTLRVHTSVLNLVDQIIVTWVIMERERAMRKD